MRDDIPAIIPTEYNIVSGPHYSDEYDRFFYRIDRLPFILFEDGLDNGSEDC